MKENMLAFITKTNKINATCDTALTAEEELAVIAFCVSADAAMAFGFLLAFGFSSLATVAALFLLVGTDTGTSFPSLPCSFL